MKLKVHLTNHPNLLYDLLLFIYYKAKFSIFYFYLLNSEFAFKVINSKILSFYNSITRRAQKVKKKKVCN